MWRSRLNAIIWIFQYRKTTYSDTIVDARMSQKAVIDIEQRGIPDDDSLSWRGWCRSFVTRRPCAPVGTPDARLYGNAPHWGGERNASHLFFAPWTLVVCALGGWWPGLVLECLERNWVDGMTRRVWSVSLHASPNWRWTLGTFQILLSRRWIHLRVLKVCSLKPISTG